MTELITREKLTRIAEVVAGPKSAAETVQPAIRTSIDRSFELPTALYTATVAAYLGFIAVMAGAFMEAQLALPMAIFAIFIVAAFGTPTVWVRMQPENKQRTQSYRTFRCNGIHTATGHLTSGEAAVQVLILPVLILGWGIAIAIIAALI